MSLKILVVGSSGVLGDMVSRELEKRGASVLRASRSMSDGGMHVDLTKSETIKELLENTGELDGVINAAGVVSFGKILETPEHIVRDLYETNAHGVYVLLSEAVPRIKQGGFFCNITGVAAEMEIIGMSAYCSSKAAAMRIMSIARRELRPLKIRVVDARPGHTETGFASRSLFGEAPKMPKGLEPESVASLLVDGVLGDVSDLAPEYFAAHGT